MKKLIFILACLLLSACGDFNYEENPKHKILIDYVPVFHNISTLK